MRILILLLGIYLALAGILLVAHPPLGRQLAGWALKDKLDRRWAIVTLSIGVLLFPAAEQSRSPFWIRLLGGLTTAKGVLLLLAPRALLKDIVGRWDRSAPLAHRAWGVAALLVSASLFASL